MSPVQRQAIIWTNAGLLLIGPLGTNFCETLIDIYIYIFIWENALENVVCKITAIFARPRCVKVMNKYSSSHRGHCYWYLHRRLMSVVCGHLYLLWGLLQAFPGNKSRPSTAIQMPIRLHCTSVWSQIGIRQRLKRSHNTNMYIYIRIYI